MRYTIGLITVCIFVLTTGPSAWAAGVRGAASGLKNPKSLNGLCTTHDRNQRWVAQGWCKTIRESLTNGKGGCAGKKFQDVKQKAMNGQLKGVEDYCPNIKELAANDIHFGSFLSNLIAALIIEESDWRDKGVQSWMGAKGLGQLSLGSVKQKAYSCGCSQMKSERDIWDGHKNAQCTAYIALHWMSKDSAIGYGKGNKGSRGIARYFQPFRDIDRKKRQRMQEKMKTYCSQRQGGQIDLNEPTPGSGAIDY